jgi:hypothetical protein
VDQRGGLAHADQVHLDRSLSALIGALSSQVGASSSSSIETGFFIWRLIRPSSFRRQFG